ncbi:serine--tRNA ligase [Candidatus Dependentiae bacterium]|nr:serine--tRNA ligase [Candidatus Dependentiae bacterium]
MIDLHLLRKTPEPIKKKILKKEPTFQIDRLLELDELVRQMTINVESLRKKRNELSKKGGVEGVTDELKQKSIELSKQLKIKEKELESLSQEFKNLALSCPNIPQDDVPEGDKTQNKVVQTVGQKQKFSFSPKNHLELNEQNNWFDMQTTTKMSGANFVLYKSPGIKILYALTHLMLKNNVKYGFEPVLPPYLVTEQALINSGNLPKFQGDFYSIPEDGLSLIPTAEVSLTNIHANQVLDKKNLPKRYTSWTSCFRREAGGYGSDERGLIRIHQFEKVELYTLCDPQESDKELERMLSCSQDLLQQLGLHYQVSLLAAQDCSFSSAKTYDIEVWLPGQQKFYEVSSCSNCTDFQARRAKIRTRGNSEDKPTLVHTLNGSSLALPRLMVAVMEQYQQDDSTIKLPSVLEQAVANLW